MPRIPFNDMEGSDRTDYCFKVYRSLCEQNPTVTMSPFPHGLDRTRFANYRIQLQSQDGGRYNGPTIEALISKIIRAHLESYYTKEELNG